MNLERILCALCVSVPIILNSVSCQVDKAVDPPKSMTHGPEHMDHNPKHGGVFFMAANGVHHLEGTLETGGMFRVYLYDSSTRPLDASQIRQASGAVHQGEFADPPGFPLALGKNGLVLEASLGKVKFPITLTLLLNLPGSDRNTDKPDLFNFTFESYSTEPAGAASR